MALTLIATPGAAESNAYADVARADAYHEAHPYASAWENADEDLKAWGLIEATALFDDTLRWLAEPATTTQNLAWPRTGLTYVSGADVPSTVIPDALERATSELARLLIESNRLQENEAAAQGLKRVKAGPVEVEFSDQVAAGQAPTQPIPASVLRMIARWVEIPTFGVRKLVRA